MGAPLRFVFPESVGTPDPGDPVVGGEMLVYDPPPHLEYRWGEETLRFDVRPDGDNAPGRVLRLDRRRTDLVVSCGHAHRTDPGRRVRTS